MTKEQVDKIKEQAKEIKNLKRNLRAKEEGWVSDNRGHYSREAKFRVVIDEVVRKGMSESEKLDRANGRIQSMIDPRMRNITLIDPIYSYTLTDDGPVEKLSLAVNWEFEGLSDAKRGLRMLSEVIAFMRSETGLTSQEARPTADQVIRRILREHGIEVEE